MTEKSDISSGEGENPSSERDRIIKSGIAELLLSALGKSDEVQNYDFQIERLAGHPRITFKSNKPDKTDFGFFDIDDGQIFDLGINLTSEQIKLVDEIIVKKKTEIEKN